jgi:ubiquinone/menaquinone biosynthesis C-methylase UbiE
VSFESADFGMQTREAYERWAPSYPPTPHNPLMRAEQRAMCEWWPDVRGRRALDLGCGSGRYANLLAGSGAADVVAVDFCMPMLTQVNSARRVCAGMLDLPFADGSFDVVISGLAVGHAIDVDAWMCETARVLAEGGILLYSDFHAEAARAGLPRSFRDDTGRTVTVPHRSYSAVRQRGAAARAGLTVECVRDVRVGHEITEAFGESADFYARWHGLALVLVVRLRK